VVVVVMVVVVVVAADLARWSAVLSHRHMGGT